MSHAYYRNHNLDLRERLDLDLLHKMQGSSVGMFLYSTINVFLSYTIAGAPRILTLVFLAVSLCYGARFFIVKSARSEATFPHAKIRLLKNTLLPLASVLIAAAGFLLYVTHLTDLSCLFLITEFSLLTVTSTSTLASSRTLCSGIQYIGLFGILAPVICVWAETQRPDLVTLAISYVFLHVYLSLHSSDLNRQLVKRLKNEIYLEKTNRILEESRTSLLEESAKSDHASRLASLGEMAGGVAHEINNPLTVITLLSSTLGKAANRGIIDKNELLDIKKKLDDTVFRISKIVRGLRTFSRNGEDDPFEVTSIETICSQILDLSGGRIYNDNIQFTQAHEDPQFQFECRSVQVLQVLFNLIQNSADAIQGSKEPWIRIQTLTHPDKLIIRVSDSGKGIRPVVAQKMFNPFFTTKEQGKGTGLGLSISLGLIKRHNGKLYLDSQASNTTFIIELPKRQGVELSRAG